MSTLLFLNSSDSIGSDSSKAIFLLNNVSNVNSRFSNVVLNDVIIPNTRPTIHARNKYLYFYEGDAPATLLTATLTEGFYSITELISHIQTTMNALVGSYGTYVISYNSITKKITITTGDILKTFRFISGISAVGLDNDCLYEIGFLEMSGFQSSKVSDTLVDVSGAKYIDIRTNLPSNNQTSGFVPPLARIAMDKPLGNIVYYSSPSEDPIQVSSFDLNQLEISLYTDRNKPFETDVNHNWSMTLKITPI